MTTETMISSISLHVSAPGINKVIQNYLSEVLNRNIRNKTNFSMRYSRGIGINTILNDVLKKSNIPSRTSLGAINSFPTLSLDGKIQNNFPVLKGDVGTLIIDNDLHYGKFPEDDHKILNGMIIPEGWILIQTKSCPTTNDGILFLEELSPA